VSEVVEALRAADFPPPPSPERLGSSRPSPASRPGKSRSPSPGRSDEWRAPPSQRPAKRRAPQKSPRVNAAPVDVSGLRCPRCKQGDLIAGRRGWGCARWREGCSFVVWFQMGGKPLTETQLRELITRGRTRKGRFSPDGGPAASGRLVLDPSAPGGAARFQPE
jgi:DNA topoisomerase-3